MTTKQIRLRKGTTLEHQNFTGALAEVTFDTTKKTLRAHDGVQVGGYVLATEDFVNGDGMPRSFQQEVLKRLATRTVPAFNYTI